jgi:hypothetical protein
MHLTVSKAWALSRQGERGTTKLLWILFEHALFQSMDLVTPLIVMEFTKYKIKMICDDYKITSCQSSNVVITWFGKISVPVITFPSVSFTFLDMNETLRESAEGESSKADVDILLVSSGCFLGVTCI